MANTDEDSPIEDIDDNDGIDDVESEGEETNDDKNANKQNAPSKGRPSGSKNKNRIDGAITVKEGKSLAVAAAKAKGQPKTKPPPKKRYKVVNGQKWCPPCGDWHPIDQFPDGSGQCTEGRKIIHNIRNAAHAQGQVEWFSSIMANEEALKRVCDNYRTRFADASSLKKAGTFPIAKYREEIKQEKALLLDGLYEMFSLFGYQKFMQDHEGLDREHSKTMWLRAKEKPEAITDQLGPNPRFKDRVAMKKADVITVRDGFVRTQGYVMDGVTKKAANQADIDKFDLQMRRSPQWQGAGSDQATADMAKTMHQAKVVALRTEGAETGSSMAGAFSGDGKVAMRLGEVKDLLPDDEDDDGDEDAGESGSACDTKKRAGAEAEGAPPKKRQAIVWLDRDEQINKYQKTHREWLSKQTQQMKNQLWEADKVLKTVTSDIGPDVKVESAVCRSRMAAALLISFECPSAAADPREADGKTFEGKGLKADEVQKVVGDATPKVVSEKDGNEEAVEVAAGTPGGTDSKAASPMMSPDKTRTSGCNLIGVKHY